jgi:hypothetical protein
MSAAHTAIAWKRNCNDTDQPGHFDENSVNFSSVTNKCNPVKIQVKLAVGVGIHQSEIHRGMACFSHFLQPFQPWGESRMPRLRNSFN